MDVLGSEVPEEADLAALWDEYKTRRSRAARNRLLLTYAPLVRYVADRVAIALPPNVDVDDLVSQGVIGLFDALEKFQPDRGVKFETYALARIRGSIIDGLRAGDWVPRSVRRRARELEQTIAELEGKLGRSATDQEIIEALGITPQDYYRWLREVRAATLTSLDDIWNPEAGEESRLVFRDMISDDEPGPEQRFEEMELRRQLAQAIEALPERERMVIALYYHEGLTLKEIGRVLGVSESRVCQLHTKSLLRLRAHLLRTMGTG